MKKKPSACANSASNGSAGCDAETFRRAYQRWIVGGRLSGWSEKTRTDRRWWCDRLHRYLVENNLEFDVHGLSSYFLGITEGLSEAGCIRGPLKPPSIKHAHSLFTAFCSWAVEEEYLCGNPMQKVPPPKLPEQPPKSFTAEEIDRLMAAARRTTNGNRDVAILHLLLDAGLRANELCRLTHADMNLEHGLVHIRNGKGGRGRYSAFGSTTADTLWRYFKKREQLPGDLVFTTKNGGPLNPNSLSLMFRRLGCIAGITNSGPHRMRHTCGIEMLRAGASAFVVQRNLGHSQISQTQRYVSAVGADDLVAAMRIASPADRLIVRRKK